MVEGGKGTVELQDDGVIHLTWKPNVSIEAQDAHAAMAAVNETADGSEYPMLMEMATVEAVSRQARAVLSMPSAASRIALLGSGPCGSRSRKLLLRRARPPLPHPLFQFPDRIHKLAARRIGCPPLSIALRASGKCPVRC